MIEHLKVIREALEIFESVAAGPYSTSKARKALTTLTQLESLVESQNPVALLVRKNSWAEGCWECAPPNNPNYGTLWADKRMFVYAPKQPQAEAESKCAQCQKSYKAVSIAKGCPKCAPGVVVAEADFRAPIAAHQQSKAA